MTLHCPPERQRPQKGPRADAPYDEDRDWRLEVFLRLRLASEPEVPSQLRQRQRIPRCAEREKHERVVGRAGGLRQLGCPVPLSLSPASSGPLGLTPTSSNANETSRLAGTLAARL
jgi:hypothetical protein